ncbi:MAG TPA: hypothetical protein VIA18_18970 [Polyangia bacterium]|nr:hypothetical protein [Polyangia bacterium]
MSGSTKLRLMMRASLLALALGACVAGCGQSGAAACLPERSPAPGSCPSSTYADASETDPVCLNQVDGTAICRGGDDAVCYVCTGADFTDGCEVHGAQTIECVHSCDQC